MPLQSKHCAIFLNKAISKYALLNTSVSTKPWGKVWIFGKGRARSGDVAGVVRAIAVSNTPHCLVVAMSLKESGWDLPGKLRKHPFSIHSAGADMQGAQRYFEQ